MTLLAKVSILGLLISAFSISGCQKTESQNTEKAASSNQHTAIKTLTIGFQKSSLAYWLQNNKNSLNKNFPRPKLNGVNFQQGHKC